MKKLTLILFALLVSSTLIKAQKTVLVCGEIDRSVKNQNVWINYISTPSTCNVRDSVTTDSLGRFSYNLTIGSGCNFNKVTINMIGCKSSSDTLYKSGNYKSTGAGPDTIKVDFKYCDTCTLSAGFIDSINNKTVKLTNTTKGLGLKYKWYFGDTSNTTSTLKNPTHTYNAFGPYTICLVVQDTAGICKDSICRTIAVGCNGFYVGMVDTIDGYCLRAYDSSTSQANKHVWSFGTGPQSFSKNTTFTYNRAGTYPLCLAIADTLNGCKDTICKNIVVGATCKGFKASFTSSMPNDTGFFFNTSTNSFFNSNIYTWKFGDGGTSTSENTTHIYNTSGSYNVTLIATDTVRKCSDSVVKAIGFSTCNGFNGNFIDTVRGDTLRVYDSGSSFNANKFTWTFGNGQSTVTNSHWQNMATHIYNAFGTYKVCLIAEDTIKGCIDTTCKQITIGSVNPCLGFNANFVESISDDTATYINTSSSSANKFIWLFGDGQTSTAQNPIHIYAKDSVYTVCLIARDTINNCTDTTCRQITIGSSLCPGFNANFRDSVRGDTVYYTNTSPSSANKLIWQFGDGQTSTAQNPMHIYAKDSVYTVCLIAEDVLKRCIDTTCRSITINTNTACIGFRSGFKDSIWQDTAYFTSAVFTSSSANKFTWTFGNGQTSTAPNPMHVYNGTGNYTVCLVAEDTVNNCKDSTCKTIAITSNCSNFNASFSYVVACDSVFFTGSATPSANQFLWDFGNGNTSNGSIKNPRHKYTIPIGTYSVLLIAKDTLKGCTDSAIKAVPFIPSLQGIIFRNNNQKADSGMVWLIRMTIDSLTNDTSLTAIDSAIFTQPDASYKFDNVPTGNYLIKAALLPGAAFYSNRMPTYYIKETRWDKATFITINKPCVDADIVLKAGTNPGGAGFIGGLVKQGANKTAGDPLDKILVLLYNSDDSPFGFTYTDINGEYKFENIAYGNYKVVVDVLGKPSDEYFVAIDDTKPTDNNGNFEVNTKDVRLIPSIPGGFIELTKNTLNIYPNPTNGSATAVFNSTGGKTAILTVTDLTGKTLVNQTIETNEGDNIATVNTQNLSSGLYIVTIRTAKALFTARLGISK